MKAIFCEVKLLLSNKKTLLIMVMVFALLFFIGTSEQQKFENDKTLEDKYTEILFYTTATYEMLCELMANPNEETCIEIQTQVELYSNILVALRTNDRETYSDLRFLESSSAVVTLLDYYGESYFGKNTKEYNDVLNLIEKSSQYVDDYINDLNVEYYVFGYEIRMLEYYTNLQELGIKEAFNHEVTTASMIGMYFNLLPVYSLLLIILFSFNTFYHDYSNGTIKNYWSAPNGRIKYCFIRVISNFIACCVVVVVPLVIMVACLGFVHGFETFLHPTIQYLGGMTSLQPIKEFVVESKGINNYYDILNIGFYSNYADFSQIEHYDLILRYQVVPMFIVLMYSFAIHLLAIFFIVVLNGLLSILAPNRLIVLASQIVLLLVGVFVSQNYGLFINKFNPYAMINGVNIMNATIPISYLNAVLVLGVSSLIIFALLLYKIRKVDVKLL